VGAAVGLAAAICLAAAGIVAVRRRLVLVRVTGTSMQPALEPGDRVIIRRPAPGRLPTGSVVVIQEPLADSWDGLPAAGTGLAGKPWVIKRIAAVADEPVPEAVRAAVHGTAVVPRGMVVVLGDNAAGADSRRWGFVPVEQVLGTVRWRLLPASRRR
jgi:signal peptidase I